MLKEFKFQKRKSLKWKRQLGKSKSDYKYISKSAKRKQLPFKWVKKFFAILRKLTIIIIKYNFLNQ